MNRRPSQTWRESLQNSYGVYIEICPDLSSLSEQPLINNLRDRKNLVHRTAFCQWVNDFFLAKMPASIRRS